MFCAYCGKKINDQARFCAYCGSPVQAASSPAQPLPQMSAPPLPKKSISPVLIGAISVAALAGVAAAGGILFFTSQNKVGREETSVLSEKSSKNKERSEKDTTAHEADEKSAESPAASETANLLRNYLETKLIPQYGTANLGAQTKTFNDDELYTDETGNRLWTASTGISDAKIHDLDQDGDEELLVFLLSEETITLCIYEAKDGEVCQTVEYPQERYSDMDGFNLSWSLLNADGTTYLFCYEQGYGIIYDFSTTNAGLYRYDGSQLFSPLVIAQTQGGSSDFVYTAYQYNSDGELLEEEVIYDETMEHLSAEQPEHYYRRTAELFGAYGIHLDNNAAMQKKQDIYKGIANAEGYETLLHLEMWGDSSYQDNSYSVVYHFNDFDSPLAFYRRFLSGEETVQMREGAWYYADQRETWTLNDILNEIENTYLEGRDRRPSIQYAYLDCGNDGVEELAVRFVGLDLYSQDDDSDLTMIITCNGSSPEVVYSCESWARSYTAPRYHGCIPSGGSAGAGDHPFDLKFLDTKGDLHTVYDARELGGMWFRDLEPDAYSTVFSDKEPSASVTHYQINDTDYYVMQSYDTSIDSLCQEYISLCEQKGMRFVSDEEISELIEQRAQELGIRKDWLSEEELSWNYW